MGILGGCNKVFSTHAIYEAPKSGLRLELQGSGVIEAGHDLSTHSGGVVTLSWRTKVASKQRKLTFARGLGHSLTYKDASGLTRSAPWGGKHSLRTLTSILHAAGATTRYPQELQAIVRAINGVMAGPKGTLHKGQSKHLRVLHVRTAYSMF